MKKTPKKIIKESYEENESYAYRIYI